jgi:hypothetical protein
LDERNNRLTHLDDNPHGELDVRDQREQLDIPQQHAHAHNDGHNNLDKQQRVRRVKQKR